MKRIAECEACNVQDEMQMSPNRQGDFSELPVGWFQIGWHWHRRALQDNSTAGESKGRHIVLCPKCAKEQIARLNAALPIEPKP